MARPLTARLPGAHQPRAKNMGRNSRPRASPTHWPRVPAPGQARPACLGRPGPPASPRASSERGDAAAPAHALAPTAFKQAGKQSNQAIKTIKQMAQTWVFDRPCARGLFFTGSSKKFGAEKISDPRLFKPPAGQPPLPAATQLGPHGAGDDLMARQTPHPRGREADARLRRPRVPRLGYNAVGASASRLAAVPTW